MYDECREEGISVVIPTLGRPHLVLRAVRSALDQTLSPTEVVVVVDGPDDATVNALRGVGDPRLKVLELSDNVGPSNARNAGVAEARGIWIAFLDDDDEWLPRKLEAQVTTASCSRYASPIVTSRFLARTPKGEFIWPRRLPAPLEPLSEYLLARNTPFVGEGMVMTSMLLARRELLQSIPFRSDLRLHEDWDWILRVSAREDVGLEFAPEPQVIRYMEEDRGSLSDAQDWRRSLAWVRENQRLLTSRAYAGFIATIVSPVAARNGEWRVFLPLLWELFNPGRPKPMDLLLFAAMWLIPQGVRRRLRAFLTRTREARQP